MESSGLASDGEDPLLLGISDNLFLDLTPKASLREGKAFVEYELWLVIVPVKTIIWACNQTKYGVSIYPEKKINSKNKAQDVANHYSPNVQSVYVIWETKSISINSVRRKSMRIAESSMITKTREYNEIAYLDIREENKTVI